MIKKAKIAVAVFMVLALSAGNLQATIIEINITVEVEGVDDPYGLLEGKISAGDIITGSYIYDSDTPDSNPSTTVGDYEHSISPYGIFLSAGGFVFQTDPDSVDFLVELSDNNTGTEDGYLLRSYNNLLLSNGVEVEHISWQLDDYSGMALSSDALPTTAPVLEDWEHDWGITIHGGIRDEHGKFSEYFSTGGPVTSVELVPEPTVVFLLGVGGVILLKKRKS